MTLSIPQANRIPELIKQDNGRERVLAALSASILAAFQNIHQAKMTDDQILDLAEGIIDTSHEDDLSIEDVLLFLKDFVHGKFGKVNDKLDMPAFFDFFEKYRDVRYKTFEAIRYENHLNLKNMGHSARSSSEITLNREEDPMSTLELMQTYYDAKQDNAE